MSLSKYCGNCGNAMRIDVEHIALKRGPTVNYFHKTAQECSDAADLYRFKKPMIVKRVVHNG